MKRRIYFLIFCIASMYSYVASAEPKQTLFVIERLHKGDYGGASSSEINLMKQHKVIRTNEMYYKHLNAYSVNDDPYDIDFSKNVVLLVDLGPQNTGGYSIYLDDTVKTTVHSITFTVVYSASCIKTLLKTNPYVFYRIPTNKELLIREKWVYESCF